MRTKLIIVCAVALILAGCASKKKIAHTAETVSIEAAKTELQHTDIVRMIDTTRTEHGRVTVTEIEYFPPVVTASVPLHDVPAVYAPPAIKSFRQTVIETQTQTRGETFEATSEFIATNENVALDSETVTKTEITPAPDPKRWRYIFYILLVVVGVVLYLKRGRIWKWIKSIVNN